MISVKRYLRLVKIQAIKAGLKEPTLTECIHYLEDSLPDEARMEKIRTSMESFCMDPKNGREGLVQIVPLSDFKTQILSRAGLDRDDEEYFDLQNWQYDRVTGYVLVNLEYGSHESVSAAIAQCYSPDLAKGFLSYKASGILAEEYVSRGFGWKCSAGTYGRILKGREVKLTAQEKMVFADFSLINLE